MKENFQIFNQFFMILLLAILGSYAVMQLKWYSDFLTKGNLTPPYPRSYGGMLHVRGTGTDSSSAGALGADFSQVYFSASALRNGDSPYFPKLLFFKDRFDRRPAYPPLTNWLYQPLTTRPYAQALLIHTIGSLLIYLAVTYLFLKIVKLERYGWKIYILYLLLFLYTPIGLFHLERGQFEFFVASAFLLLFACTLTGRHGFIIAIFCALAASVKWSSFPFIGTFGLLAFISLKGKSRYPLLMMGAVIFIMGVIFRSQIGEYLEVLKYYELQFESPLGFSFSYLLPVWMAKGLPIVSTLLISGLLWKFVEKTEREKVFKSISFLAALALALQGLGFGTIAHEYRAMALFSFIPLLPFWLNQTGVSMKIKKIVSVFFAFLLVFLFRSPNILFWLKLDIQSTQPVLISGLLLLSSLFLLGLSAMIIVQSPRLVDSFEK